MQADGKCFTSFPDFIRVIISKSKYHVLENLKGKEQSIDLGVEESIITEGISEDVCWINLPHDRVQL